MNSKFKRDLDNYKLRLIKNKGNNFSKIFLQSLIIKPQAIDDEMKILKIQATYVIFL